jgi:hypothetical protein
MRNVKKMNKKRKIEYVGGKVSFAQAEENDLLFEASLSWQERLERMELLRRKIWAFHLGAYPVKIAIEGGKRIKNQMDEDDF